MRKEGVSLLNGEYFVPLSRAEGLVGQSKSGGGNPNQVQTITGTYANPWGEVGRDAIANAIANHSATAYISVASMEVALAVSAMEDGAYGIAASSCSVGPNVYPYLAFMFLWTPDGFTATEVSKETGKGVNVTQDMSEGECTLTIIWHPLP